MKIAPGWAAGAAALAAATLVLSGPAQADPTCTASHPCQKPGTPTRYYSCDELDYVVDLDQMKIPYTDTPAVVDTAHMVCKLTADHYQGSIPKEVQAKWTVPITLDQAVSVVLAAHSYVCSPVKPVDYDCSVTWEGPAGTVSKQSCIDAFLAKAHAENLTSRPSDGRSSDSQLVSDGLVACKYAASSGDINVVAAQVRRIDSTLSGGKPTFGDGEDTAAVAVVWIANETLCP